MSGPGYFEHKRAIVFRLNDHGQGPELLRRVFLERGWLEFDEEEMEDTDWNIWWKSSRFRISEYSSLMPWQRINHYPKATAITKKDALTRNMRRMKGVHGASVFNFSPLGFNLPNDYTRFVAEYTRLKEREVGKTLFWICKPADLSRGRGISIFRELNELQYDCNAVVQHYINNPLLISGYKFDLRIYVAVPSFNPLNIYVYQEGLVRFGTEKFDLQNLNNLFSHLTNTSINKHGPLYYKDKERIGPGCKWTLTQLRHYLRQTNIDDNLIFLKIINMIILTLATQADQAPQHDNCFELFGFDVIIDEKLKPWLLEVNFSPALGGDCNADEVVKKPMLHSLMDMMNFQEEDKDRGGEEYRRHQLMKSWSGPYSSRSSYSTNVRLSRNSPALQHLPQIRGTKQRRHSSINSEYGEEESEDLDISQCSLPSVASSKTSKQSNKLKSRQRQKQTLRNHSKSMHHVSSHDTINSSVIDSGISSNSGSSECSDPNHEWDDFVMEAGDHHSLGVMRPVGVDSNHVDLNTPSQRMTNCESTKRKSKSSVNGPRKQAFSQRCSMTNIMDVVSERKKSYPRPWIRSKSTINQSPAKITQKQLAKNPIKSYGDFMLVFPFNEVLQKDANSKLQMKVVIKECQKLLRDARVKHMQDEYKPSQESTSVDIDVILPWVSI